MGIMDFSSNRKPLFTPITDEEKAARKARWDAETAARRAAPETAAERDANIRRAAREAAKAEQAARAAAWKQADAEQAARRAAGLDWKSDPATARQFEYLSELGVNLSAEQRASLTKGAASRMIDNVKAQRAQGFGPGEVSPYAIVD